MGNRKGMTAVFLTMILAAVLGVTALLFGGACSAAAKSMSQGLADLAGRSVLSGYHRGLKEEYGIFGLYADGQEIGEELGYYIRKSLSGSSGGKAADGRKERLELVRLTLEETKADPSEYLLLKPEVLEEQILDYMKYRALLSGANLLNREQETRSGLAETAEAASGERQREREAEEAERRQEEEDSRDDGEESDEDKEERRRRRREKKKLLNLLAGQKKERESWSPESEGPPQRTLKNEQIKNGLPSQLVKVSGVPDLSAAFSGDLGQILAGGRDSVYLNEYILRFCSNYVDSAEKETFFRNEIEYILCGHYSDQANIRQIRLYLFGLRTSLNLAHIYSDSPKRQTTFDMALSVAPGPGAPLVQLLIATLWAGAESEWDIRDLLAGEPVPLVKTRQDWNLSLDSILTGGEDGLSSSAGGGASAGIKDKEETGAGGQGEKKGQTYQDYLRLFLMVQNREARLVRLMDVIQLNVQLRRDRSFRASDYCSGFVSRAVFARKTGLFAPFSVSGGYIVEKIQKY